MEFNSFYQNRSNFFHAIQRRSLFSLCVRLKTEEKSRFKRSIFECLFAFSVSAFTILKTFDAGKISKTIVLM
jgi:hypothetical protein